MQTIPANRDAPASGEIDWALLLLLARTEAAMTWPDMLQDSGASESLPDGLDLRHPCDLDWVSRVVLADNAPAPGGMPLRGEPLPAGWTAS
ncbi:hypothetical protein [Paramagnetospirillum magneticum]|uniref:Uncharacterized protein n=1 Tax=Paramagnetospirillum magneticum (strain ATCC 700264 / AMB-1) TaxID=342108 RepID=Q2VZ74_PARM1|nr:hypothetical protein [Paramagnetospirillum magneticum]BAE53101.1 hypothetical protein amb4297 [Paramagnetospirillum magneticum AMB-1]